MGKGSSLKLYGILNKCCKVDNVKFIGNGYYQCNTCNRVFTDMRTKARKIYNSDVSPLRFIIKSNGDVRYTKKEWWEFWK